MKQLLAVMLFVVSLGSPASAQTPAEPVEALLDEDGVQRLTVAADSYLFEPRHILVRAGLPVELTFIRKSFIVPHNIVLEIPADGIAINSGISRDGTVVRFTPRTPGTYPFYCDKKLLFFESHREKGMEGVLEVQP